MEQQEVTLRGALAGLRAQQAELQELLLDAPDDADLLALRAELLAAIADARQAAGGEAPSGDVDDEAGGAAAAGGERGSEAAGPAAAAGAASPPHASAPRASVPHTAAPGNAGIHPRNRCAAAPRAVHVLSLVTRTWLLLTRLHAATRRRRLTLQRWRSGSRCWPRFWCAAAPYTAAS
jgi:hypothetical protein